MFKIKVSLNHKNYDCSCAYKNSLGLTVIFLVTQNKRVKGEHQKVIL